MRDMNQGNDEMLGESQPKRVFLSCNYCTKPIVAQLKLPMCTCRPRRSEDASLGEPPCPYSPRAKSCYGSSAPPVLVSSPRSELPMLADAVNGGGVPLVHRKSTMSLGKVPAEQLVKMLAKYTKIVEDQEATGKENHEPYVRRATLLAAVGDYERSRCDARRACQLEPSSAVSYYRLGIAEYELGSYEAAVGAFVAGLEHAPTSVELRDARQAAMNALRTRPHRLAPLQRRQSTSAST